MKLSALRAISMSISFLHILGSNMQFCNCFQSRALVASYPPCLHGTDMVRLPALSRVFELRIPRSTGVPAAIHPPASTEELLNDYYMAGVLLSKALNVCHKGNNYNSRTTVDKKRSNAQLQYYTACN